MTDIHLTTTLVPVATAASPAVAPFWHPSNPMFMMLLVFGVFYFIVIAPMRKKQKVHSEMLRQLRAGDRVITNGGIYGTVVGVTDDIVQLRIADQVKIEISKSAVSGLQQTEG